MVEKWIETEFASVDLGDRRLDNRLKSCVSRFASIGESTPDANRNPAALKATYRFVNNPRVDTSDIFNAHNQSTIGRCKEHVRVYLVQDTTELDLTKPKQQVRGAGPLGTDQRRGFFYHPLYAVNHHGLALGMVDQVVWTRDPEDKRNQKEKRRARKQACFEEKESARWLEMLQMGEQIARSCPGTEFIAVSDSESDIAELFAETDEFPSNFHFILRACQFRTISSAVDFTTAQAIDATTLDEALSLAQVRLQRNVAVGGRDAPALPNEKKRSRNQARISREATLSIRAIQIVCPGLPRPGGGRLKDAQINIVEALEEHPPEGEEPIRWVLLTTLPITSDEKLIAVMDGYCQRWSVENFFKTLKSGLAIEDLKYESLTAYLVAFSMYTVAAWRIEYLKTAARADPESPCSKYFPIDHWVAIMTFVTRAPVDQTDPPTTTAFLKTIAKLGGYIDKKSQGSPGSRTIWRGMRRYEAIVEAYSVFSQMTCGV